MRWGLGLALELAAVARFLALLQLRGVGDVERRHLEQRIHLVVVSRDDEIAVLLRLREPRDHRGQLQPHAHVVRAAIDCHLVNGQVQVGVRAEVRVGVRVESWGEVRVRVEG